MNIKLFNSSTSPTKCFILVIFMFCCLKSYGQGALESNDKTKNLSTAGDAQHLKLQYEHVQGLFPSTFEVVRYKSVTENLPVKNTSDNEPTKTTKPSKISVADSLKAIVKKQNEALQKIAEDNKKKILNDSLKNLNSLAANNEYNLQHSIEVIQFYKTKNIDSNKVSEFRDSIVSLIATLIVLNKHNDQFEIELYKINDSVGNIEAVDTNRLNNLINIVISERAKFTVTKTQLINCDSIWNTYLKKYAATTVKKPIQVSALPFFNVIPGLKDANASLNIIGSNTPKTRTGNYVEIGLYTGILKTADSSNANNIFITEASNYAFYYKSNMNLTPGDTSKTFTINLAAFYLNKAIGKDSSKGIANNFNSSFFQGKIGFEYVFYKNISSVYANGNAMGVVTDKASFDKRFGMKEDIITYVDFGVRMLLNSKVDLGVTDGIKLYFDLNFILNQGNVNNMNPGSKDVIIPNFRLGLRADLGRQ